MKFACLFALIIFVSLLPATFAADNNTPAVAVKAAVGPPPGTGCCCVRDSGVCVLYGPHCCDPTAAAKTAMQPVPTAPSVGKSILSLAAIPPPKGCCCMWEGDMCLFFMEACCPSAAYTSPLAVKTCGFAINKK